MRKLIITLAAIAALTVVGVGCASTSATPNASDQAASASQSRAAAFAKAQALYPSPIMKNFPLRKALVALTQVQDEANHPWYIYQQAQATGQIINYYVGKTAPQSVCDTLSNTQAVVSDPNSDQGSLVLTSPSLNGYYAGGAGATGNCSVYFFQDESTGAIVELYGNSFTVMDQPLALKVPRLHVGK